MRVLIGFSTSQWWVSRLIRFATRSTTSHAFVIFDDIPDVGHELYEAAWCGFRMSTRAKLASGTTYIVKEIEVDVEPALALATCRTWLETPYDYTGLAGQIWTQIGRWLGFRWRDPWASPHAMYCSEAAARLLQIAGKPLLRDAARVLDPRSTDPRALETFLGQTHG